MYISPLGVTYEYLTNNSIQTGIQQTNETKFKVELFADKLGVTKTNPIEQQVYTIQQYDELQHRDYKFVDESSAKSITSVSPAGYTYHTNVNNDKEVIGFLPYWSLASYEDIDYSKFSTLAYFSLTSDDTGAWVKGYRENGIWYDDGGYVGFNSTRFTNMVSKAHAKGVKVVLLVKNFDPYSIRQIVNNTNSAGDRLINNIVRTVESKGLDGVNIDFEYIPRKDKPNDTVTDNLRAAFASFHDRLADRMHAEFPKSLVSTDTFGSSAIYYHIYDIKALGKTSLDYIVLMTYDYITTKCYVGKYMSPMSPLYGNDGYNISTHLQEAAEKAGSKKIVMGVPYYGIDFQVKTTERNNYNALVDYPNCDGTIETYASIVNSKYDAYHNASTLRWNNTEKARWYVYSIGGKWRQGYYDDASSLGAKYDFVRSANLGGVAIWAVGYDNNAKELYDVLRDKFQKVPFYVHFGYGVPEDRISDIFETNNLTLISSIGNNTFLVEPQSTVSGTVMSRLKLYNEVLDVRFELDGISRKLN